MATGTRWLYVGTYTRDEPHVHGRAEGIYVFRADPKTGALSDRRLVARLMNPSFLALDPTGSNLYAVAEVQDRDGQPGGGVAAYAIDRATGELRLLNEQSTIGQGPCHVSVDATGKHVLVANYGSGSVVVYPRQADGSLGAHSHFIQHEGGSVNPQRQQGPHAHSITPDPTNAFALVADLGLDKVLVYRLDHANGTLSLAAAGSAAPGSGPRHLDFHPSGKFVFVNMEILSTLTAYRYDGATGRLEEVNTLSTLPAGYAERTSTADTHVHPNGRFVYTSNRGHDSLAIFAIDPTSGRLTAVGHASTRGKTPRNFAIDPAGAFVYAANQNSSDIAIYTVDQASGQLTPLGDVVEVPTPVCLKFLDV